MKTYKNIMVGVFLLVCMNSTVFGVAGLEKDDSQPEYAPGEIIVKFKRGAADNLAGQLNSGKKAKDVKLSDSLDKLGRKYGVSEVEQFVKNFKANRDRIKNLKKKDKTKLTKQEKHLLKRLKRAPNKVKVPELDRIYKIKLETGQSAVAAVTEYKKNPDIEYAELNYIVSICATPNDPNYSPEQWALNNDGNSYPVPGGGTESGTADCDIDAPEAWDICTGSNDVIVAVIDSGVDYSHRDLVANMWTNDAELNGDPNVDDDENGYIDDIYGYDFCTYGQARDSDPNDDFGHGTHCAGIIAADGNNGLDIAGVSWNSKIMALRFIESTNYGWTVDAVEAIVYAVDNGADIISNSWFEFYPPQYLKDAVDYAVSQGVVMIAAAANGSTNIPVYPAGYANVIAVAATDSNDVRPEFSNYGDWIYVAAPGVDILSLCASGTDMYNDGNHYYPDGDSNATMYIASGTSMACPQVSGLAALCLAEEPNLTPGDVKMLIRLNADDVNDPNLGYGRINAYATLADINDLNFPDPNKATQPDPCNGITSVSLNTYLSWTVDEYASSHDVYFGADFNDVNDANTSSSEFKGNFYLTEFDPNTLDVNSTYYWRIDEKNFNSSVKGNVWSFTTRNSNIIYVDVDANGSDNGISWVNAYDSLADGVSIAWDGDQIWVAAGTYKPTGGNDRSISFEPRANTQLYGGFAGTESSVDDRNPDLGLNVTTLSGDINSPNDIDDNSYHVLISSENIRIDRFTITGGNADEPQDYRNLYLGGGILNLDVDGVLVNNCTFTKNKAAAGGGIFHGYRGALTVSGSIFTENESSVGAGITCYPLSVLSSYCNVINSLFIKNKANAGGGIFISVINNSFSGISVASIANCTFVGNEAAIDMSGGIYLHCKGNTEIKNCVFWGNDVNEYDQIYNYAYYDANYADPNISYCDIQDSNGSGVNWDSSLGSDDGGNIDQDPCFVNVCDFYDTTDANGTTTTIDVCDASLYEVNDVIEYDDDGVVRTVSDVNTTTDIVTFSSAIGANSVIGTRIRNWGIGATDVDEDFHIDANSVCINAGDPNGDYSGQLDIDGQWRVMDANIEIGADEVAGTGSCETCLGDIVGATTGDPPNGIVNGMDLTKLTGMLNEAYFYTGEYIITEDDPVMGYLWKYCADIVGDTTGDPPNAVIDSVDLTKLTGLLNMAYFYYGVYEYECGDPNIF